MKEHSQEEGYIKIDPRENQILSDLRRISETSDLFKDIKIKRKIKELEKELRLKLGLEYSDELNYKLLKILKYGESSDNTKDFDTKDRDIEKFIMDLKKIK